MTKRIDWTTLNKSVINNFGISKDFAILLDGDVETPVKISWADDATIKEYNEIIEVSKYERITVVLREMLSSGIINISQYRSVRGQARRGNTNDPLKFIINNGFIKAYDILDDQRCEFGIKISRPINLHSDSIYGICEEK